MTPRQPLTIPQFLAVTVFYWWVSVILVGIGAPVTVAPPKFEPALTWDERHPQGWAEWGNEKRESVPVIKWGNE